MRVPVRALRIAPRLLVAAPLLATPSVAAAQSADERAVIEVVEKLFDAMRTRDTLAMKGVFMDDARLIGQQVRDGQARLQVVTVAEFVSSIAAIPADREIIERIYDPKVDIDGDLASFWSFYTLHVSEQFSHCGVDAVHLFRTPDGWKIASLADTRRRDDCEVPGGAG